MADRYNKDVENIHHKNYWKDIERLVNDKILRETVLDKKDAFKILNELEVVKSNNNPISFIQLDNFDKLRSLACRVA